MLIGKKREEMSVGFKHTILYMVYGLTCTTEPYWPRGLKLMYKCFKFVQFLTTNTHSGKNTQIHRCNTFAKCLNSQFYGSMESCRLACHLLICLHFTLLCFSTLPLNFRGGMRSLIAALPGDLFFVVFNDNETESDNLLLSSNKIKIPKMSKLDCAF